MKRYEDDIADIMVVIKSRAKSLGYTQESLAKKLKVSHPTVKRWLTGQGLTFHNLLKILDSLGFEFADLTEILSQTKKKTAFYNLKQEQFFSKNPDYLAFFDLLLKGQSVKKIQKTFKITNAKIQKYLSQLDNLKLIQWMPGDQAKLIFKLEPVWRKNGPLSKRFKKDIVNDFLGQPNTGDFILNNYLPDDIKVINQHLDKLKIELLSAAKRAQSKPGKAISYGTYIAVSPYRWKIEKLLN